MPEYAYVNSGNLIKNNRLKLETTHLSSSSSAPRLSFSTQDIFNLRNHNLSQISRSTPGIYNSQKKDQEQSQEKFNLPGTGPKGILVKQKEDSISGTSEVISVGEKEDRKSLSPIRREIQFTVFVIVCFFFLVVIPLSMIVVGSIYMYSCTTEPMIPVFLVVSGSAFLSFAYLFQKLGKLARENENKESCYTKFMVLLMLIQLGWFAAGCCWVYGSYLPDYNNKSSLSYCNKTLYLYAFWFLNGIFLTLFIFMSLFVIYVVFGKSRNYRYSDEV